MVTHLDHPPADPAGNETGRDKPRYLNRELSTLEFNARVLALSDDPLVPLLERVKFLAIFSSNLDEFFQVRVAALKDMVAAHLGTQSPDGRNAAQQLEAISDRVGELVSQQEQIFLERVKPALAATGVGISDWDDLDDEDRKYLIDVFEQRIFPVLTPLSFDPGHPFPYISNLSLNLGVTVADPDTGEHRFARVKVPPLLPRFVITPDGERFVPLEQVIAAHLPTLFLGMDVIEFVAFRVTRNADLTLEEEEADDLLEAVEMELRRRRFGRAVRLEVDHRMSQEMLELLLRELDLEPDDVSFHHAPLGLSGLWAVHALPRPELKDDPWIPTTPPALAAAADGNKSIFSVIREGDVLLHHPYDSFATSIEEFIRQASIDPAVLAIKMTLYRTSGDSPIIASLIRASEAGKQVAALVELKARFDEQTNIAWAKALEQVGVHVVYGLMGLKTHTKTALVIREEAGALRRYSHVGTGNYNSDTARLYEDLGLLSADPDLGADLIHLFNHLTGYSREVRYRKLLVAPRWLRPKVQDLILGEAKAGMHGRIIIKMNSLVDPAMIDALCEASQAGVEIDLIIRSICCLRPGVPGVSERIRVRSLVGRYLEHSRIYYFANGSGPGRPTYYIGSADLMERNLDRRVEALAPVEAPALQARLQEVLDVSLTDDVLAWQLDAEGHWTRVQTERHLDAHRRLQELALSRSRMSLEREAKFSTWPGFELPELDRVLPSVNAGARTEARLDATYWDTPDLRLIRWGITVRHRAQGGHGEWTVKLPGTVDDGVLSRPEYNFDGSPTEMPFEVRDLVRAYARTTPLEPVARLQTVRRSLPLFDPRGHRIAEVADDEVSVLDGDRVAARFREVELEVVETAPPALLPALIERLRAAGAGHSDPTPKLVRALGPRALAAPELSAPGLDENANVGDVLRAAMTSAVLRILHHDAIVRLDSGPEGVHQARVGTRRLRSDLRTFAPILDETWMEGLREELSWLAEALGRVRDADVLLARLERASTELAAQDQRLAESVRMRLRRQRAVHRRALLEVLRSDAYVVLLDRLVDAARSPRLSEAAGQAAKDALPALVRRPWKKLTKAVDDLEADGALEHRHEVRIRGKRVRYAADAASLAVKDAAPMAKALAEMQDVLGEEHDAVVAEEWLRGIAVTNVSRAEALVIGMLIAVEQREAREWASKWSDAWAAVSKRKARQWLT